MKGGPGSYRGLEHSPDDWEDWYNLVFATASHMVDRHGLAEVSAWKWEVWNECWGNMDYPHPYVHFVCTSCWLVEKLHGNSVEVRLAAAAGT